VDQLQGLAAQGLVLDQAEGVDAGLEVWQEAPCLEQFQQHDVAHAKAEGGEVDLAAADELDEVIVAAAPAMARNSPLRSKASNTTPV